VVDIQTVSIVTASAGVFVAAVYYILQIRHQARVRQTDLVMKLYSEYGSKELLEAYSIFFSSEFKDFNDFRDKYPTKKAFMQTPAWVAYHILCMFYERVGNLLHRKLIDIELVDNLMSSYIKNDWEKVKPIVEGMRKEDNVRYYEWFEYLYNEMKKRDQQLASRTA
jgi:hypothetical protein